MFTPAAQPLPPIGGLTPRKDNGFRHETGNYGTKPRSTPPTRRNAAQTTVSEGQTGEPDSTIQTDEPQIIKRQFG